MKYTFELSGLPVTLWGDVHARDVIIRPVGRHDTALLAGEVDETARLCGHDRFCLAFLQVSDWNRDLAPWTSPPVFGDEGFGDGAPRWRRPVRTARWSGTRAVISATATSAPRAGARGCSHT